MKIHRSSKLYFSKYLTQHKKDVINMILAEYSRAVNYFIKTYHHKIPEMSKFELSLVKYRAEYVKITWLGSTLVQCAFAEGYGMVRSYKSNLKHNKSHSLPVHYGKKMMLNANIVVQSDITNTKLFDFNIRLKCIGEGLSVSIPLKKHRQFNKWQVLGKRASTVVITKNYIQVSFATDVPTKPKPNKNSVYIGLDTGINTLAYLSNGNSYGLDTRKIIEIINRKQHGSKAQQSKRRSLKQYMDKAVVDIFTNEKPTLIVVEKLKNMKYKMRRRLSKSTRRLVATWIYAYWLNRIQQKCEENRVYFRSVPAYNTSITCSRCGNCDKKQRYKEVFVCGICGNSDHADHNASVNILNRFLKGPYNALFAKIKPKYKYFGNEFCLTR